MNKFVFYQKEFLRNLSAYINGGCLTKIDLIMSSISNSIPFKKNAKKIIGKFNKLSISKPYSLTPTLDVEIEPYRGRNTYVLKMSEYLSSNLREDLKGAYVHGSLGTYDETAYSDFDALVIIRNDVFNMPQRMADVAMKLNSARSIMYEFDPLQHHGWFVLTEYDLRCFPRYYFPLELFKYSKSLFSDGVSKLSIWGYNNTKSNVESFYRFTNSMLARISKRRYPTNMYQLKSFLSQFMLLPALYIQAKYNKEIYKKFSFEEAKKDFKENDWSIMDEVSSIRDNWKCEIQPFIKFIMSFPNNINRFYSKHFAPKIPHMISEKLSSQFYEKMNRLILLMHEKLKQDL